MVKKYSPQDDDTTLIEGCRAQHALAEKYLFERYFGLFLAVTFRYANDRSEAVAMLNDAFLQIFQSINRYQATGSFRAWMKVIVVRTALKHVRSKAQFSTVSDDFASEHPLSLQRSPVDKGVLTDSNEAFLSLDSEYILQAIQKLPPATRTVFNLYEIEGYTHAEVAELLNISVGTSKWHLADAKKKLQNLIKLDNATTQRHEK
jgi:RNA polymerase sigma factor (sigma-70 family)